MDKYIAYCGLDCRNCDARTATINDDDGMRCKVAELWSKLNNADITPEMINCVGCRIQGAKTVFCEALCPIRQCALAKEYETCGDCSELQTCGKVQMIIGNNEEARCRLIKGYGGIDKYDQ